ncbi:acetate/propionate family kinase [Thalassotalea hakodatensis]|uniref:acetate/propionate family kinase n=1 Tax=Thalassotalea hakodatensis TaxID=3030492 RepID=UPI0025742377|nr:acetate kinase [Thalassotalea hakodatensis]
MQNNILVINCGSSSVKFSLINPTTNHVLISGLVEQLHSAHATISIKQEANKQQSHLPAPYDHLMAIKFFVEVLDDKQLTSTIYAIGHRVVHGGETYNKPVLISIAVKHEIHRLSTLAPLHNPANLLGIEAAEKALGQLPQVAVFDTSFHQSMPKKAFLYALPYELYKNHGIRKYGFHGTSHYYVAHKAAQYLNKPIETCNLISAHLGNGCSVTAIKNGKSVDTSLGLTPLEGLMMGTRTGNLDPSIIFHLVDQLGYTLDQVNTLLNKESGLKGISMLSNDCRTLEEAAEQGHDLAKLALDMFCYRAAKMIASFSVCFSQLDSIVFTGGIGENSSFIRENIIEQLTLLNISINNNANIEARFGKSGNIATSTSIPCWVIPTDEEGVIATQTHQLVAKEVK